MWPAAIAQADYLLPPQEVQFLWHNGAQIVSCTEAATAVQPKHKYLGNNSTNINIHRDTNYHKTEIT